MEISDVLQMEHYHSGSEASTRFRDFVLACADRVTASDKIDPQLVREAAYAALEASRFSMFQEAEPTKSVLLFRQAREELKHLIIDQHREYGIDHNRELEDLISLQGEDLHILTEFLPPFYRTLQRIAENEENIYPIQAEMQAQALMAFFEKYIYDAGILKGTPAISRPDLQYPPLEGIAYLSRLAVTADTIQRFGDYETARENCRFFRVDIADFMSYDQVERGISGDRAVMVIAHTFKVKMQVVNAVFKQMALHDSRYKDTRLLVGRYSGDEWVFRADHISDPQLLLEIYNCIVFGPLGLTQRYAEKVLPGGKKEIVTFRAKEPFEMENILDEDIYGRIYWAALGKNMILSAREQTMIRQDLEAHAEKNGTSIGHQIGRYEFMQDRSIWGGSASLDRIKHDYPELITPINNFGSLCEHLADFPEFSNLEEEFLTFINQFVFSPILGEPYGQFEDLKQLLRDNQVEWMLAFDVKLKEPNDLVSPATGDEILGALAQKVERITNGHKRCFRFCSRGGTLFLVKVRGYKDDGFDPVSILDQPFYITVDGKQIQCAVNLNAPLFFTGNDAGDVELKVNRYLYTVLEDLDLQTQWALLNNVHQGGNFSRFLEYASGARVAKTFEELYQPEAIAGHYLGGKRAVLRTQSMLTSSIVNFLDDSVRRYLEERIVDEVRWTRFISQVRDVVKQFNIDLAVQRHALPQEGFNAEEASRLRMAHYLLDMYNWYTVMALSHAKVAD